MKDESMAVEEKGGSTERCTDPENVTRAKSRVSIEEPDNLKGPGEDDLQPNNALSSFILHPSSLLPHPSSLLRVLLWDIDGTLMRSARVGAFKDYTIPVLETLFGTAGRLHEMQVSGMTDLQIVAEALRHEGITHDDIRGRIDDLRKCYMSEMTKATSDGSQGFELLPGVREALAEVHKHPRYRSALVTGNIEPAAYLKMELMGLSDYFDLPGAFGDESHERNDLPALAAERIRRHLNLNLEPSQFIVIGDTPNDIACARHFGAKVLAVGTGRMLRKEQLLACEPDAFLPDLSNLNLFFETLERL